MSGSPPDPLVHLLTALSLAIGGATLATISTVMFLRWLGLHWTWTLPGVLLGPAQWPFDQGAAGFVAATAVFRRGDRRPLAPRRPAPRGGPRQDARDRRTPLDATRERMQRRDVRGGRWIDRRGLAVGRDQRGRTVRIPVGHGSGRHTIVVGATGTGKTVTQAWIAARLIGAGHGAVVIDPKGDRLLHDELEHAARKARRMFRFWTPRRAGGLQPVRRTAPTPSSPTRSSPARPTPSRTTCAKRSATSVTPSVP